METINYNKVMQFYNFMHVVDMSFVTVKYFTFLNQPVYYWHMDKRVIVYTELYIMWTTTKCDGYNGCDTR